MSHRLALLSATVAEQSQMLIEQHANLKFVRERAQGINNILRDVVQDDHRMTPEVSFLRFEVLMVSRITCDGKNFRFLRPQGRFVVS